MNKQEQERRARLMKMQAERLPEIKRRFEENQNRSKISESEHASIETGAAVIFEQAQKRNFNSNFKPGGKDFSARTKKKTTASEKSNDNYSAATDQSKNKKTAKTKTSKNPKSLKNSEVEDRKVNLSVSTRRGDMVHHQRMLSQDVNAQATQHIIGIPVNKSRYNGYNGAQVTNAQLKSARPDPEAVRIIPIGGVGEFGIGKNMTAIEYKGEIIVIDMGVLFAGEDYPGVNYMVPDIKYLEDNMENIITLADEYFDSFQETDDMITFFKEFDSILDNVDSYRIKVPNSKVRDKEIENWLCGKNFVSKNSAEIRNYYSYTVSWVLNAIANRFNTEEDNKYKELFESMGLIASYGVPSKWAVQIYLCGIHSRLSATELSQNLDDDNNFEKLWEVILFLQNHADSILDDEQYSDLTKAWVNVLVKEDRSNFTIVPKFNNFKFEGKKKDVPDLLFCKRYNDRTYLCSEDYKFKVRVKDTETLHFSDVADIPGIYFLKKNDVWKMHNVNPYIEIK